MYAADVCTVRCKSYSVASERGIFAKLLKLGGDENSVLIFVLEASFDVFFFPFFGGIKQWV